MLHRTVIHEHAPGLCGTGDHVTMIFCSERHRQFFINGHHGYNNLPPGYKFEGGYR